MEEYTWTKEDKRLAKKLQKRSSALSWIHENASGEFDNQNKVWTMFILVSTYILGGTGMVVLFPAIFSLLVNSVSNVETISVICGLVVQMLVVVLGILSTIYKAKNLPNKIHNHARASVGYADMFLRIKTALKREPDRRQDFSDFFSDLYRLELQIRADAGPIPSSSINTYNTEHGSRALKHDELFGELISEEYDSPTGKTIKKSIKEITDYEKFQLQRYGRTSSLKTHY